MSKSTTVPATRRNMEEINPSGGPGIAAVSTVTDEKYSATAGDYFWAAPDEVLRDNEGEPMILAVVLGETHRPVHPRGEGERGPNADRALKAERAVCNYETDSDLSECLSDLLGDIRHMCDLRGIDFAERDKVGHRNYIAELGGVTN